MITPFTASGDVDHEKAWRLARFLSDNGSDALVVTGTTGVKKAISKTIANNPSPMKTARLRPIRAARAPAGTAHTMKVI